MPTHFFLLIALFMAPLSVMAAEGPQLPCITQLPVAPATTLPGLTFHETLVSGQRITLCRVDLKKTRLRLFLNDDAGRPFKTFANLRRWLATRGETLHFAMNAGMYHSDFRPVGLFISEGREFSPLNLADTDGHGGGNFFLKPNGVFGISSSGAWVLESSQYARKFGGGHRGKNQRGAVQLATQSGPLLVLNGQLHPAFKPDATSRLYRNGVGVESPQIVWFAISEEPVNFHTFATLFQKNLRCSNALFFDGSISSLCAPALGRDDFRMSLGSIIGIAEPNGNPDTQQNAHPGNAANPK